MLGPPLSWFNKNHDTYKGYTMTVLTFEQWLSNEEYHDNYIISNNNRNRRSLATKIGSFAGKTVRFLKATETKASFLVGYWTVESIFTLGLIAALFSESLLATFIFMALWSYFNYAFFSAFEKLVIS